MTRAKHRYRYGYCRDCGNRTRIYRYELLRSSPPRCNACGGMLDLSEAGAEEYAAHHRAFLVTKRETAVKQGFKAT